MIQLQTVEQKLLAYDPTFTTQQTHASMASQRSALISAFRPQYEEGDIEGLSIPLHSQVDILKRRMVQGTPVFI